MNRSCRSAGQHFHSMVAYPTAFCFVAVLKISTNELWGDLMFSLVYNYGATSK